MNPNKSRFQSLFEERGVNGVLEYLYEKVAKLEESKGESEPPVSPASSSDVPEEHTNG